MLEREEKGNIYSLCDANDGNKIHCFWDRYPFEGPIFRIPIRKVYVGEKRTYTSNINGNVYTIRDKLNTDKFYYETDGHFCSPECRLAFLEDEERRAPQNALYANSHELIMAEIGEDVRAAPHWKILAVYGGTKSIDEFRASFSRKEYVLEEVMSGFCPYLFRFKESYHL